jgi:hypothetical protein
LISKIERLASTRYRFGGLEDGELLIGAIDLPRGKVRRHRPSRRADVITAFHLDV